MIRLLTPRNVVLAVLLAFLVLNGIGNDIGRLGG